LLLLSVQFICLRFITLGVHLCWQQNGHNAECFAVFHNRWHFQTNEIQ